MFSWTSLNFKNDFWDLYYSLALLITLACYHCIIIRKVAIACIAAYRVVRPWLFLYTMSSLYRLIAFMIATNAVWSGNVVLVGNLFYLILYQPNRCNFDLIFIAFMGLQSRLERAWSKADFDAFYAHLPKRRLLRLNSFWLFLEIDFQIKDLI